MELISRRVAAGLQVEPSRSQKHSKKKKSSDNVSTFESSGSDKSQGSGSSVDWKKWGDRLALGKSAVKDFKRLKPGMTVRGLLIIYVRIHTTDYLVRHSISGLFMRLGLQDTPSYQVPLVLLNQVQTWKHTVSFLFLFFFSLG